MKDIDILAIIEARVRQETAALAELDRRAVEIRGKRPKLTYAMAYELALKSAPDVYERYVQVQGASTEKRRRIV